MDADLDDLMEPVDELEDDGDLPEIAPLPALDDFANDENLLDANPLQNDGLLDTLLDPGGGGEGETAVKKTVNRKPIPKLDATRLTGERGLPSLMKHFENVKFKGKGHEVGDLDRLMRTLEHWAHRLFPKMPFDDVIERIEKLGSKKPVQTCLKKIRLDMPLLDEDFVTRGADEAATVDGAGTEANDAEDIFPTQTQNATQPPPPSINTPKVTMTDEQRERIERNKRLAMERRLAKQQQQGNASSQQLTSSQNKGLDESELDTFFSEETGKKSSSKRHMEDEIDSDEEEMEREFWSQLRAETKTGDSKKEGVNSEKDKERVNIEKNTFEGKNDGKKDSQKNRLASEKTNRDEFEIDSDEAELEDELWNQMTEPVPTQTQTQKQSQSQSRKTSNDDDDMSQVPSRKRRRVILDEDEDDDDDVIVPDGVGKDICNDLTEPIISQVTENSQPKETHESESSQRQKKDSKIGSLDDAADRDEIWNQMTEPIPSQVGDQPDRGSHDKAIHSKTYDVRDHSEASTSKTVVLDDDETQMDTEMAAELCNQMTEAIDTDQANTQRDKSLLQSQDVTQPEKLVVIDDETQIDTEVADLCDQETEAVDIVQPDDLDKQTDRTQIESQDVTIDKAKVSTATVVDDDETQMDTEMAADLCHQMTEAVDQPANANRESASQNLTQSKESEVAFEYADDIADDDLDDSTLWTQITSTNPGEEIPSSLGNENDDGLPSSLNQENDDKSKDNEDDKDNGADLEVAEEESQSIFSTM